MGAWLLGLGLAAAADGPASAPATVPTEPRLLRQAPRTYPPFFYRDLSVPRSCVVDATLDAKGRPVGVVPVDCPPELERWTVRRVRRDRWAAPVPEGTTVRVDVVYTPPVDVLDMPTLDTWRRREQGQCELHLAVAPTGEAVERRGSGCEVGVAPFPPTPPGLIARTVPGVCPLTFSVVDGRLVALDLFRCPLGAWVWVREGLAGWTWPAEAAPRPWSVLLQLDGPDPGPRTWTHPAPLPR